MHSMGALETHTYQHSLTGGGGEISVLYKNWCKQADAEGQSSSFAVLTIKGWQHQPNYWTFKAG